MLFGSTEITRDPIFIPYTPLFFTILEQPRAATFQQDIDGHDTVVTMGGSHIFGFTGALRKKKAAPFRPILQTSTESNSRSLVHDTAAQGQNDNHNSTRTQEGQEEYSHVGIAKDLSLGSLSASELGTEGGTLVVAGDDELGQLLFTVRKKASSQLLGNQNYESSHDSRSRVDQTARSLRGYGSSSTLRSYYEPQKIPLAVSQQTSNSSARDFALRKGCPPVVPIEKPVSGSSSSHKPASAATLNNTKKTSPTRLDLSMLFPKPLARHDRLISSQLGEGPTDAVTDQLVIPPAVPLGPSTGQKHRLNVANTNKAPPRVRQTEEIAPSFDIRECMKKNKRKPRGGIKYWFDNFEDEDLEAINPHENVEFRPSTKFSRNTRPAINIIPAKLEAHDHNPNASSLHHKVHSPEAGSNRSHLPVSSPTDPRTANPAREVRLALQNWEVRTKHRRRISAKNSANHFRKGRSNPLHKADLHRDSILWLSSSDDESEADDSLLSDIGNTIPGIRDSLIVGPSEGSDVEIGTAHAIKTKRPKLEKESPRRRSHVEVSRVSESPLKTVEVPERQSSRMFSFLSDQSRSLPNTREGSLATRPITATSSELVGDHLKGSTTTSQKHNSLTRLMTVTPQEESFLEAIRSKRVSMCQNIIAETFRRPSEGEQGERTGSPRRPQTSGFEGNSASFLHLSQESVPTLSAFHNHRRSMSAGEVLEFNGMEPRNSCSTDPLTSHSGSLAQSSLPSSSSQESPATPTLEPVLDTSTRRTSRSMKRYSTLPTNYQRHSRVRTGSSEVIVLDNVDDNSSFQFKQDELPIWAFNGWTDWPGLAIVH